MRRDPRLLLPAGAFLALALACAPKTEYLSLPPEAGRKPPPSTPIYAATLADVTTRVDGKPLPKGPELVRSYARTLRRSGVFTQVAGPGDPHETGSAELEIEARIGIDQRTEGNLARSILIGATLTLARPLLAYRVGMDAAMSLDVRLPGTGEVLRYGAHTEATRTYYGSGSYPAEVQQLMRDVTNANLRSIIAQMQSDRTLTARPAFGSGG